MLHKIITHHSLLLTLVLSCNLAAAQHSRFPLKSLIRFGLGAALLYNFHHQFTTTKHQERLLINTSGSIAAGYLIGGLAQPNSTLSTGDFIASGVLGAALISSQRPYPKLSITIPAVALGIVSKMLSYENDKSTADDTTSNASAPQAHEPRSVRPS